MKLKPSKWSFAMMSLKFFGHIVAAERTSPDPEKVVAVQKMSPPSNKSQLRSFLGLTSYYRKFIRDYASVALPLTKLLGEDALFSWGAEQQEAFDTLKSQPTTYPVLVHPNWENKFILQTDASNMAIGAVLAQEDEHGDERVVQYASRKLTSAEGKWDTREKELIAIIWGCETFRPYILGRKLLIETDGANPKWLLEDNTLVVLLAGFYVCRSLNSK